MVICINLQLILTIFRVSSNEQNYCNKSKYLKKNRAALYNSWRLSSAGSRKFENILKLRNSILTIFLESVIK